MNKFKEFKFKTPRKGDYYNCHVTHQYVTNGHWLFSISWLDGCGRRTQRLRKLVQNLRVDLVARKLKGEATPSNINEKIERILPDLSKIPETHVRLALSEHEEPASEVKETKDTVPHVLLRNEEHGVRVAINTKYVAALEFCPDVEIFANRKDRNAPLLMLQAGNLVAMVMPVRISESGQ